MNAKHFRIVSVAVAVRAEDADSMAQSLSDVSGNFGIYSMGTCVKLPNRAEWNEIREQVPDSVLVGEHDFKRPGLGEIQRRDEKHGLYGGREDVAN